MKTIYQRFLAWFTVTALAVMSVAAADSLVTRNGAMISGSVVQLGAAEVSFSADQAVAWTNIISLRRDRAPLQAPGQRLELRNGTALCGIVRRAAQDRLVFCSVTAGPIDVAWTNVTAIRFQAAGTWTPRPAWTGVTEVVKTDGTRHAGSLALATRRQLLLRTSGGVEKYEADDVAWLLVGPPSAPVGGLTLRNGDRLCGPVTWLNDRMFVDVNGKAVGVERSAIQRIESAGSAQEGKE